MTENAIPRRGSNDYKELDRLLEQANVRLEEAEPREAHVALRQASVKAASMWGEVGGAALPQTAQDLILLTSQVQKSFSDPRRDGIPSLAKDLRRLRDRFDSEKD